MQRCIGCGKDVEKLVTHHWFELPNMGFHAERICPHCNSMLRANVFYPGIDCPDHVLPCWDEQLAFLRNPKLHKVSNSMLYRTYDIERIPLEDEDGEYYRVTIGFDSLQDAKKCLDKWIDAHDIAEGFWQWDNALFEKELSVPATG